MAKLGFTASEIASKKYVDDAIANAGGGVTVDQTYNAESENPQSGKAVAKAVDGRVPRKRLTDLGAPFDSVIAVDNSDYSVGDADGNGYGMPNDSSYHYIRVVGDMFEKNIDNYITTFENSIPKRDNRGNLFTGTPIDDEDCVNKKYITDNYIPIKTSELQEYQVYAIPDTIGAKSIDYLTVENPIYFENGQSLGTIPSRQTNGNIMTNAPVKDLDCANKKYVDDKIAEIPSGGGGTVDDVQINGNSIVTDGVANIPIVTNTPYGEAPKLGVVGVQNSTYGINITTDGLLQIKSPNNDVINQRNTWSFRYYNALTLDKIDYAVKAAMCDGQGAEWTEEEKTAARDRMGINKWEVISDTTTEFDTPVSQIVINQDTNGNSFSLKKMRVFIDFTVSETYTGGFARALTASSGLMYIVSQSFSAGTVYGYFIDSEVLPMVNNRCQIISHFNENRMSKNGNNFNFEYNSGAVDYAIRTEKTTVTLLGYNVSSISNFDFRLGSAGKINKARILIFGVRA